MDTRISRICSTRIPGSNGQLIKPQMNTDKHTGEICVLRRLSAASILSCHAVAGDVDGFDCPRVPDVGQWILLKHNQVCPLAGLERAEILRDAEKLRRVA